ncbi:MAG: isopentenyl-diphosphate Delta-isomerase [Pseudomonadota bacterium]
MTEGEIVSSELEELILVDENDVEIGHSTKSGCHDGQGLLHRAFSVFVFNSAGEVLLQQRAAEKRLWPGYWSNSCCSHPRRGEALEQAVHRRLEQELGIHCSLSYLYKFLYHACYGDAGSEYELCSVFVGTSDDPVRANTTEISACRYITPAALDAELEAHPERFTPWFKLEWPRVKHQLPQPNRHVVNT